ncbi:MAG: DUF4390 domain-containing protein [Halothiobacillaceae bacterium]
MTRLLRLPLWLMIFALGSLLPPAAVAESRATILHVHSEVRDDRLFADVDFSLSLSEAHREALRNGVILSISLRTDLLQPRQLLWPRTLAGAERLFRIEYHALSETYLVHDESERETWAFANLRNALETIGRVRAWPVAEVAMLPPREPLEGRTRVFLQVNRLPLPIRLKALTHEDWQLESPWFLWIPRLGSADSPPEQSRESAPGRTRGDGAP